MSNLNAKALDVLTYLSDISIILIITATTSIFMGLNKIQESYHQKSFKHIVFNILWSSGVGMGLTAMALGALDHFVPEVSVSMQVAIAVYIGMFGMKGMDYLVRKKLKVDDGILDLMDKNTLGTELDKLTHEEQLKHRQNCPLKHLDKEIEERNKEQA